MVSKLACQESQSEVGYSVVETPIIIRMRIEPPKRAGGQQLRPFPSSHALGSGEKQQTRSRTDQGIGSRDTSSVWKEDC